MQSVSKPTVEVEPEWSIGPTWRADLEYTWRVRVAPEVSRLQERARRQRTIARALHADEVDARRQCHASAKWAEDRAASMAASRTDKIATCGVRTRRVRCGCGERSLPVGCDVTQLCETCRRAHWKRWRKIITRCLDAHLRSARGTWARDGARTLRPEIRLMTLTVPHSGSLDRDRALLSKGWNAINKVANVEGWWSHYAATFEATPGTRGDGHVHMHVAIITVWFPYKRLHELWNAATGACIVDIQRRARSPHAIKRYGEAGNAAYYIGKYVTKGVDNAEFTGTIAGELMVAQRGRRKVTTSRHFWRPWRERTIECHECGHPHRLVSRPGRLTGLALSALARASWFRMRPEDIQGGFDWYQTDELQVGCLGRLRTGPSVTPNRSDQATRTEPV